MTRLRIALTGLALTLALAVGCGSDENLSEEDIKAALEGLPFEYEYRAVSYSGAGAVVAGTARFEGHEVYFAVIEGDPQIEGRVIPRQRLPDGGFQRGVDTSSGPTGTVTKFVYTPTSIPRIPGEIETAICEAASQDDDRCHEV